MKEPISIEAHAGGDEWKLLAWIIISDSTPIHYEARYRKVFSDVLSVLNMM